VGGGAILRASLEAVPRTAQHNNTGILVLPPFNKSIGDSECHRSHSVARAGERRQQRTGDPELEHGSTKRGPVVPSLRPRIRAFCDSVDHAALADLRPESPDAMGRWKWKAIERGGLSQVTRQNPGGSQKVASSRLSLLGSYFNQHHWQLWHPSPSPTVVT
jgi:hypothetical protein